MSENRPAIPAEIKREVLVEAGHRCAIQTCRHDTNIDVHHIIPWEKCRAHKAENLIALCPNCHRSAHDGKIDRKSLLKYKEICQKLTNPPNPHIVSDVVAFIKFNPNITTEILDACNISSLADYGILDFSFHFLNAFEDDSYVINAIGDGSVSFVVIEKTTGSVHIKFNPPCPNIVRLEFKY